MPRPQRPLHAPWRGHWRNRPPRQPSGHAPGWHRKRSFLLRRFFAVFFVFFVLVFGSVAAMTLLVTKLVDGDGQNLLLIWIGSCGLAILVPLLIFGAGMRTYRRYAAPLADVMAAADAVADGDLSVRVSEQAGGEIGGLARSFNHMTEELERNDQQRRNMSADVAHELRTPLHIIQGNLEGVLDKVYEPTDEHIAATLDEARSLGRLVEDLQTISLVEAGQLPMQQETVDVGELLTDISTSFGPAAEIAEINLQVAHPNRAPSLFVYADPGRLDQIVTNLVANALRHTPAGGQILLDAILEEDLVQITVADNGDGISEEDLPRVFDRFWRGDRSRSRHDSVGGGLGLAIVRQLVEAHGGHVAVESEVSQGTTFTVTLPQYPGAEHGE